MIFAQSVIFFGGFYIMSFILTMSCSDWFLVWMGLEINMMSFIPLVYIQSSSSVEVCLKYFFIQSIGSGILVLMFFIQFYWFEYLSLGVLSYKMGSGPFYFWFPPVCDSLGWGGCYLLMTVQKILPLLLMAFFVSMLLWMIISISLTIGALGAMNQKSMKRLMAYSSIHHMGWMLACNFVGPSVWFFYLVLYTLMLLGVVVVLWKGRILMVGSLKEVSSKWSLSMGMLSMGGIPPMLGFYLKWFLFYHLIWVDFSLLLLMLLMSVLMFYVYTRVVYVVMMGGNSMSSWSLMGDKDSVISGDTLYLLGLNMGVCMWLMI